MKQLVTLTNGEKVTGCGITLFDQKNKPIAPENVDPAITVVWTTDGGATIAQIVQSAPNSLGFDVTTEGDDVGVVTATATITRPDGTQIMDSDGTAPQLEATVRNSAANSASVSVGTTVPE